MASENNDQKSSDKPQRQESTSGSTSNTKFSAFVNKYKVVGKLKKLSSGSLFDKAPAGQSLFQRKRIAAADDDDKRFCGKDHLARFAAFCQESAE